MLGGIDARFCEELDIELGEIKPASFEIAQPLGFVLKDLQHFPYTKN